MSVILIDLQYLPTLEYFCCIHQANHIIIDACENFEKQTFRNRTTILTANGPARLSVPVIDGTRKVPIQQIYIDYKQKWTGNHWRAIQSAYGKAPYFEYYADYFKPFFDGSEKQLFALNQKILTLCLKLLHWDKSIELTKTYQKTPAEGITDLRSVIHPKKEFTQRNYYMPVRYPQLFGRYFVPNLSIVDLLFCEGPNAGTILWESASKNVNN